MSSLHSTFFACRPCRLTLVDRCRSYIYGSAQVLRASTICAKVSRGVERRNKSKQKFIALKSAGLGDGLGKPYSGDQLAVVDDLLRTACVCTQLQPSNGTFHVGDVLESVTDDKHERKRRNTGGGVAVGCAQGGAGQPRPS